MSSMRPAGRTRRALLHRLRGGGLSGGRPRPDPVPLPIGGAAAAGSGRPRPAGGLPASLHGEPGGSPAGRLDPPRARRPGPPLHPVQQPDIVGGGRLPRMRGGPPAGRRGRRGRRTGPMIRIARERMSDLFALARSESARGGGTLPHRYVFLARRIGMRFNLRLPPEYRTLYCRRCSSYWVEGRTVRTRLRAGRSVRTCLVCGAHRRVELHRHPRVDGPEENFRRIAATPQEPALAGEPEEGDDPDDGEEE